MAQSRRRKPAQERWINELSDQDLQKRIRVLGSVVDLKTIQDQDQDQIRAILDDGTGRIQVIISQTVPLELGNKIRILGLLGKNEQNEYLLTADIVQDMSGLDIELYKRVQTVKRKFKNSLSTH